MQCRAQRPRQRSHSLFRKRGKKARDIINRAAKDGIISVVENWHQVSYDRIEFTVKNLKEPD
jgi:hypothetical protein